jgi:hypothetical protein
VHGRQEENAAAKLMGQITMVLHWDVNMNERYLLSIIFYLLSLKLA